jgi:hypothetical protein
VNEYWDGVVEHYEGFQVLQAKLVSLGLDDSNKAVARHLSMSLLDDVLVAAGGVENAVERLRDVKSRIVTWVEENNVEPDSDRDLGIAFDGTVDAWYSLVDALVWGRTFYERLERRRSPQAPTARRNQGLVPAIATTGLEKRANELLRDLRHGPIGEMRTVTNFTLHSAMPQNPLSGARLTPSGQIVLPFPDEVNEWVGHWHLFEWSNGRDGFNVVEEMWSSVQFFMDELLDAFEQHDPQVRITSTVVASETTS